MVTSIVLKLISGVAWAIVYVECIRLGRRDQTFAMPFFALGLNLAWEFLYTLGAIFYFFQGEGDYLLQISINSIWFVLDVGILITYFKYGRRKFERNTNFKLFIPWSVLGLICAFLIQCVFFLHINDQLRAVTYSAFLQNFVMSILYIDLFLRRENCEGQSLLIAIGKMIGTIAPTILFGFLGAGPSQPNYFVIILGSLIFAFDGLYLWLLMRKKQEEIVLIKKTA